MLLSRVTYNVQGYLTKVGHCWDSNPGLPHGVQWSYSYYDYLSTLLLQDSGTKYKNVMASYY